MLSRDSKELLARAVAIWKKYGREDGAYSQVENKISNDQREEFKLALSAAIKNEINEKGRQNKLNS